MMGGDTAVLEDHVGSLPRRGRRRPGPTPPERVEDAVEATTGTGKGRHRRRERRVRGVEPCAGEEHPPGARRARVRGRCRAVAGCTVPRKLGSKSMTNVACHRRVARWMPLAASPAGRRRSSWSSAFVDEPEVVERAVSRGFRCPRSGRRRAWPGVVGGQPAGARPPSPPAGRRRGRRPGSGCRAPRSGTSRTGRRGRPT